jgi:hypothetical protein
MQENTGNMRNFSVNSVNYKYTFEDGHSCFLSKGKSKAAQERYETALCDLTSEHGNITAEVIISYLAWDKNAKKGTPSIRVKSNAFGRPVEPGHSFRAEPPSGGKMDKGVFVPTSFKPFRREQPTVSYDSVEGSQADEETPYTGDEPDQA